MRVHGASDRAERSRWATSDVWKSQVRNISGWVTPRVHFMGERVGGTAALISTHLARGRRSVSRMWEAVWETSGRPPACKRALRSFKCYNADKPLELLLRVGYEPPSASDWPKIGLGFHSLRISSCQHIAYVQAHSTPVPMSIRTMEKTWRPSLVSNPNVCQRKAYIFMPEYS
jgi:hypothetical protein